MYARSRTLVSPIAFDLNKLEQFLQRMTVDRQLSRYRGFEEDLRDTLNPTTLLEETFWVKGQWLDFPEFSKMYIELHGAELRGRFEHKFSRLGSEVYRHIEARLYRTQFGFLTEYHAVILVSQIASPKGYEVYRGSDLDRVGVDCQIVLPVECETYNIHIFVDSPRAWSYRKYKQQAKSSNKVDGHHIDFPYTTRSGCVHSLKMLSNGFGVYTTEYVTHLFDVIQRKEACTKTQKGVDCCKGLIFE